VATKPFCRRERGQILGPFLCVWEEFSSGSTSFILSTQAECPQGVVRGTGPSRRGRLGRGNDARAGLHGKGCHVDGCHISLQAAMLTVAISRYTHVCSPSLRRCMSTANLSCNIGLTVRRQVQVGSFRGTSSDDRTLVEALCSCVSFRV